VASMIMFPFEEKIIHFSNVSFDKESHFSYVCFDYNDINILFIHYYSLIGTFCLIFVVWFANIMTISFLIMLLIML